MLGSTGSIGTQTLDIVVARPDRYEVVAIGAARSLDLLVEQAERFRPPVVAIADASLASELVDRVPVGTEVLAGGSALAEAASTAEVVVNGVVGFAGLPVTLAALESGRRLCLANKESLIAAGPVVREARNTPGAELLPVDSEHCAVHQCLRGDDGRGAVDRVVLTASGGPFRGWSSEELADVTIEEALAHPTWSMGPKVTIDSSTLMNKGLEVIEAHELFDVEYDRIDVVVHPQSVVHSLVELRDGSQIAQLGVTDMRLPIQYAFSYPDRWDTGLPPLDLTACGRLEFGRPDTERFPCLALAYRALGGGPALPVALNAANEVAVQAFLDEAVPFTAIPVVIAAALDDAEASGLDSPTTLDEVRRVDARARAFSRTRVGELQSQR